MFTNYKLMSIFLSLHRDDVFNTLEQEFQLSTPTEHPTEQTTKKDACVNCGSSQLVKNNGSILCSQCGVFNDIIFDDSLEYNEDGTYDQCRTSIDPRFVSMSYATVISTNKQSRFSEQINSMRRAHFWNTVPSKEQTLFKSFNNIKFVCENNSIKHNIMLYAQNLMHIIKKCQHSNVDESGHITTNRADNINRLEAACVYYACRHYNEQISELQIGQMFHLKDPKYDVGLGQQMMHKIIHKEIDLIEDIYEHKNNLIDTYCKCIKCPENIRTFSNSIYTTIDMLNILNDHSQQSIAIGIIYFVLLLNNIDIPKTHVALVCTGKKGATATIDKIYNKLVTNFSKLGIV